MKNPVLERLIPRPRRMILREGLFRIPGTGELRPSPPGTETVRDETLPPEGYTLKIRPDSLKISHADEAGLRYAFATLEQLAEADPDGGRILPALDLEDFPAMPFRGIHFCVFPETTLLELEKNLRLAAFHKFNYAVLECWGNFPFESHPEIGWSDRKLDRTEFARILRTARETGITPIPQLNLLGHAAMARAISGKHAVLYGHPELEALFEPTGWSWCLSNPKTREILKDLVVELHDFFGKPPFFHIGCDEAEDLATCHLCRTRNPADLLEGHLNFFHDLLAARGARVILWHDMLLQRDDPRWKFFVANGKHPELEDFYRRLPKDVLIGDWEYGIFSEEERGTGWPTADFFRENGFDVLLCPWNNESDAASMGRFLREKRLSGMLTTTWHLAHDLDYTLFLTSGAYASWNPDDNPGTTLTGRLATGKNLLRISREMNLTRYEDCGYSAYQVPGETHPHPLR